MISEYVDKQRLRRNFKCLPNNLKNSYLAKYDNEPFRYLSRFVFVRFAYQQTDGYFRRYLKNVNGLATGR